MYLQQPFYSIYSHKDTLDPQWLIPGFISLELWLRLQLLLTYLRLFSLTLLFEKERRPLLSQLILCFLIILHTEMENGDIDFNNNKKKSGKMWQIIKRENHLQLWTKSFTFTILYCNFFLIKNIYFTIEHWCLFTFLWPLRNDSNSKMVKDIDVQ